MLGYFRRPSMASLDSISTQIRLPRTSHPSAAVPGFGSKENKADWLARSERRRVFSYSVWMFWRGDPSMTRRSQDAENGELAHAK